MDTDNNATPIRVGQIIGKMWAGGVEAVIFNYYRAIDHKKVQFDFYYDEDSTVDPPIDLIQMGARFYRLPPYQKIWRYLPQLHSYLAEQKYSIVHSHLNTLSVFPLYVSYKACIPVRIAHNHSVPEGNEWARNILKYVLKRFSKVFATHYFACSEKAGRWLFGNTSYNNGDVYLMKNAVDFSRFFPDEQEKDKLKSDLGIRDSFIVGHVGRFTFAKNHDKLIRIFKQVLLKLPNSKLLLVGDGELHDQIIKIIDQMELTNNVILVGKVQNPEYYYRIMDVVVVPSIFEGFSMTTIEAQASKVPVVVSEAIPEEAIISDGCIYKKLSDSDEEWADTAINISRKTVSLNKKSEQYDIHRCAKELEQWYLEHQN